MLRHIVLLSLTDQAGPEDRAKIVEGIRALPEQVPEIRALTVGIDLGLANGNADIAIVADFDDEGGWRAYQAHPAHRAVIDTHIAPVLVHRLAAQITLP